MVQGTKWRLKVLQNILAEAIKRQSFPWRSQKNKLRGDDLGVCDRMWPARWRIQIKRTYEWMCDAHITIREALKHIQVTPKLVSRGLCLTIFFFSSYVVMLFDEENILDFFCDTFAQCETVACEARRTTHSAINNPRKAAPQHWHKKCVVNFYYISAAVIHSSRERDSNGTGLRDKLETKWDMNRKLSGANYT